MAFIVDVVHVKLYGKKSFFIDEKTLYVYCGRPSKLSNPFFMENESKRDFVISEFSKKLPMDAIRELHAYCIKKDIDVLNLGCFCAPKRCHCDVIKDELAKLQSSFS